MRIMTWNINGLRSFQKNYDLKMLLDKQNIDILHLQETKLVEGWNIREELKLTDEWYIYQNIASSRKGYSGVASIARLEMQQLSIDMPNLRFQSEGRMLLLQYKDYKFINIYFPQGDRTKKDIPYKLEVGEYIRNLIGANHEQWIIAGDFNMAAQEIDLARPNQNRNNNMFTVEERAYMSKLKETGLQDVFRSTYPNSQEFTWWPYAYNARERNIGWRLDYIFISENLNSNLKCVEILKDELGSDHCPVLMEIDLSVG